jgi:hypothetical protein
MNVEFQTKAVVTVAEMARMVGLSRARFYQLIGTAFPHPVYDVRTRRPSYGEDMQRVCLEVRRRNCGVDGTPILFYARGNTNGTKPPAKKSSQPKNDQNALVLDGLKGLGLVSVTEVQVDAVVRELYPTGTGGVDQGEVLRAAFLRIKRQDCGDSVGR